MQEEAAYVTDCFDETTAGEGEGVGPGAIADSEVYIRECEGEEEGEEEDIGWEGRVVAIDCVLELAGGSDFGASVDVGAGRHGWG